MRFTDLVGKYRFYYLRGWWYFSIFQAIVIFLMALKVFYEYLVKLSIPMELFYLATVVVVFAVPPMIGIVEFDRIGHIESQRAWEVTPATRDLCRQVREIHQVLCEDDHR